MKIINATIFGENGKFHVGDVEIENGYFKEISYHDETFKKVDMIRKNRTQECKGITQECKERNQECKGITQECKERNQECKWITQECRETNQECNGKKNEIVIDAQGLYLVPGLVDLHFHGCVGRDFSDGDMEGIRRMACYEASQGITSICPATMTLPQEELFQAMRSAREYVDVYQKKERMNREGAAQDEIAANFVGINLEGPFVSAKKRGAQPLEHIRKPELSLFRQLQEISGGQIRLLDLAPEEEGALELIGKLHKEVRISLAHSVADYDCAMRAFCQGARQVTHLYNGMSAFGHRQPGIVGAAFDYEECMVELICDGIHVHPSMIRATFQMFGEERIILISDSIRATGLKDGEYTLGGQKVKVEGKLAILDDQTIAGSVTNLMDCLRYMVKQVGISLEKALLCATANPAKAVGIYDRCGSISKGKRADFLLMNQDLGLLEVYIEGKKKKIYIK